MVQETGGLTLKELLTLVVKDFKIVLTLGLVGLVLGAAVTFTNVASSYMSRTYTVSMDLAVIAENYAGGFSNGRTEPGSEDVTAARNSTYTAARIVEGDQVLNAAIKKLGLIGVESGDIAKNLKAEVIKDSQILTVTLVWNDADEGVEIMNAIAEVTPDVLIQTLKLGNASIIDSPKIVDTGAGMSKNLMMILVGLLAGLFLGIAVVVLRDMFFPKVVDPFAVREVFGVKLLGAIADDPNCTRHKRIADMGEFSVVSHQFHESFVSSAHVISHHLRSVNKHAEAVAAGVVPPADPLVLPGSTQKRARIIYVTSSVEQEGKSTCTARLAVNLAKEGWKTLLIDCDLRNPSLAPMFFDKNDDACKMGSMTSMNAIINRGVEPKDAVINVRENLDLLPSAIEEQRIELNYRTAEICTAFAEDYDVILIDTPPIGQVSDAMTLNRVADEAIFVVRYNYATYQMIQANLDVMAQSGIPVLGAIVNRIDTRFSELPRHYARYSSRYSFGVYNNIPAANADGEEPAAEDGKAASKKHRRGLFSVSEGDDFDHEVAFKPNDKKRMRFKLHLRKRK